MPSSMALLILRRNLHGRTSSLLQARLFSPSPEAAAAAKRRASEPKPVEKILVADGGEIACRIMRTVRRLGIRTVAVYSDADAGALHVRSADQAARISPAPARLSYLCGASIIDAALRAGAQVRRGRELTNLLFETRVIAAIWRMRDLACGMAACLILVCEK